MLFEKFGSTGGAFFFCLPVSSVILEHHGEGLAVTARCFEVHQLVPGSIVRLTVHSAPLHPDDVDAPAFCDLIDEDQRLLALLASVLEKQVYVRW